jgi:hypothetical protein
MMIEGCCFVSDYLSFCLQPKFKVDNWDYVKLDGKASPGAKSSQGSFSTDTASTGSKLKSPESRALIRLPQAGVFFEPRSYDKRGDDAHPAFHAGYCE